MVELPSVQIYRLRTQEVIDRTLDLIAFSRLLVQRSQTVIQRHRELTDPRVGDRNNTDVSRV